MKEEFDFGKHYKKILKVILVGFTVFLLSVLLINIIEPAFHRKSHEENAEQNPITGDTSVSGGKERILCIDENEDALMWRLRMIGSANETIILTTFDLRSDKSGTDIISALYAAAERGVSIQILVDGIYRVLPSANDTAFQALVSHENVDARIYNPVNLKNIYRVNYRMHDKYLIVDGMRYLLGGRNTNDIFLGDNTDGINIDRDILVCAASDTKGSSLLELQSYFEKIWSEPCVQKIRAKGKKSFGHRGFEVLEHHYEQLKMKYPDIEQFKKWDTETYEAERITLISNGTSPEQKAPMVLDIVKQLAGQGQDILIQTPYIICDEYMYGVLEDIAGDAEVNIILNAVERGSNPWGCTDYLNNKNRIIGTGVTVFELINEHAVHTKAVLVDDNISIVGSYNYDMRSTYLDTELMLIIDSKPLNTHIRETANEYMKKSKKTTPDGNEIIGMSYESIELSGRKKLFYSILRGIIIPFRHLL